MSETEPKADADQRTDEQASAFSGFAEASREVVRFLRKEVPLSTWMVSRIRSGSYVILDVAGMEDTIAIGKSEPVEGTICQQMISGQGPNIAPDLDDVPAYAAVARGYSFPVRSYIGFPITRRSGEIFGTLCAIDVYGIDASMSSHASLISLLARQLATILDFDLQREDYWRQALLSETAAVTDSLTEVLNRRGWDFLCEREEERARHFGHPLSLVQIDLDGLKQINDNVGHAAGDMAIRQVAQCLREQMPKAAALARTGGDEFSILLPNCTAAEADRLLQVVRSALTRIGISVSVGMAECEPALGIEEAWNRADAAMYANKRERTVARFQRII